MGQYRDKSKPGTPVVFGPSKQMDYELEFAAIVGKPLPMRQRLKAAEADDYIFGFVVLNDWSGMSPAKYLLYVPCSVTRLS
jgi:fumarylacetoacetase